MYDTSDIRKGLKVLMDGNPFTVVEFQFVKPGKGSAFTRTKFKNLLTMAAADGSLTDREIRFLSERSESWNISDSQVAEAIESALSDGAQLQIPASLEERREMLRVPQPVA